MGAKVCSVDCDMPKGLEKGEIGESEWGDGFTETDLSRSSKSQLEGPGKGEEDRNGLQAEASYACNKDRGMELGKGR